jgi:hypothetical protein
MPRLRETVRVLLASCSAMSRPDLPLSVNRRTTSSCSAGGSWNRRMLRPLKASSIAISSMSSLGGVGGSPESAGEPGRRPAERDEPLQAAPRPGAVDLAVRREVGVIGLDDQDAAGGVGPDVDLQAGPSPRGLSRRASRG